MLAQDRFETETPNVIDPGDCPPSYPGRKHNDESSEESSDGILRGSGLQRHDNKHSLYTRNGNKGALSKGIPLRFVLSDDTFSDEDSFSDEQEIVFQKKRDMPYFDENHTDFQYDTKQSMKRFLQDDDDDDDGDEEENGIAQARLFAAAMLNESNRRSTRDLGIRREANPLRQMMHRASSFRMNAMKSARSTSIRSLGKGSSHHSIPLDSNSNSNRSMSSNKSQEKEFNIWLVDDNVPTTKLSKTNLLWKKVICSVIGLIIAIIVLSIFGMAAGRSQASVSEGSDSVAHSSDHRLDEIVHYLSETTGISSQEDFQDAFSPQSKAASWLAYEDSEKLDVPTIETRWAVANEIASPFDFVQRYVLLVFYFALGGDANSWTKDYHFASEDRHECSWFERMMESDKMTANHGEDGFSPTSNSSDSEEFELSNSNENSKNVHYFAMGVSCNRDLKVESIFLPSNNLKGSIPSEIQYLSSLRALNLRNNSIEGTIPEEIQNLVHLTRLDLSGNRLAGELIPLYSWVGETLNHLEILDLSDNQLNLGGQNTTHSRRQIRGETRLQTLSLGGNVPNNISEYVAIPDELRLFTNLEELYLDNSNIGGRIPAWLFYELPKLQMLDVSQNQLTGSISGEFPAKPLQNLEFLLLHDNPLTGTLPESIGYMSSLTTITIHHTNMTVGTDAANLICWQTEEESLESLTTDCGDATCPCCIENCCDGESCYPDVDWHSGISSSHQQAQDNRVGNEN